MKRTLLLAMLSLSPAWADLPVVQSLPGYTNLSISGRYAICAPEAGYQAPVHILDLEKGVVTADLDVSSTLRSSAISAPADWVAMHVSPQVMTFRISDGKKLGQVDCRSPLGMAASPDGKLLVLQERNQIKLYTPQLVKVREWSAPGRAEGLRFLNEGTIGLGRWRWTTSGKPLANGPVLVERSWRQSPDGRFKYDATSGEQRVLDRGKPLLVIDGQDSSASFSADSRQVAVWSPSVVQVYSLPDCTLRYSNDRVKKPQQASVGGDWLVVQDEQGMHIHNLREGEGQPRSIPRAANFYPFSLVAPGKLCVSSTDETLRIYDGAAGRQTLALPDLVPFKHSVAPDGATLLAMSPVTRQYSRLNLSTGKAVWSRPLPKKAWEADEKPIHGEASWSRDGQRFMCQLESGQGLHWVADGAGKVLARFPQSNWTMDPGGAYLAGYQNKRCVELSIEDGKPRPLPAASDFSYASYSPGGEFLALHGNMGFNILRRGQEILRKSFAQSAGCARGVWSPNGRWVALASPAGGRDANGDSYLVDTTTLRIQTLKDPDRIGEFRFSPDGRWLMSGGHSMQDGALWQLQGDEWRLLRKFRPKAGEWEGYDAEWTSDSKVLVVNRYDSLRFYSVPQLQLLGQLRPFGESDWVAFTPEGAYDGSPGGIQRLALRGTGLVPAAQRPELRRPGLLSRWLASH